MIRDRADFVGLADEASGDLFVSGALAGQSLEPGHRLVGLWDLIHFALLCLSAAR